MNHCIIEENPPKSVSSPRATAIYPSIKFPMQFPLGGTGVPTFIGSRDKRDIEWEVRSDVG